MITRRNLLSTAGATGALTMASQVAPALATEKPAGLSTASYSGVNAEFIKRRQKSLLKDQNLFMGYPDNQKVLPEGYYKWRDTMFELDFGRRTSNTVGDPSSLAPLCAQRLYKTYTCLSEWRTMTTG